MCLTSGDQLTNQLSFLSSIKQNQISSQLYHKPTRHSDLKPYPIPWSSSPSVLLLLFLFLWLRVVAAVSSYLFASGLVFPISPLSVGQPVSLSLSLSSLALDFSICVCTYMCVYMFVSVCFLWLCILNECLRSLLCVSISLTLFPVPCQCTFRVHVGYQTVLLSVSVCLFWYDLLPRLSVCQFLILSIFDSLSASLPPPLPLCLPLCLSVSLCFSLCRCTSLCLSFCLLLLVCSFHIFYIANRSTPSVFINLFSAILHLPLLVLSAFVNLCMSLSDLSVFVYLCMSLSVLSAVVCLCVP